MIDLGSLFDSYNRQARLYPALIALLPPLITVLAWYPVLLTSNATATAVTLVTSCGLLYSFMAFSRSRGKNVERRLLADWGGWPTTLWLRHADSSLSEQTKARYHAALGVHVPNLSLPSSAEEKADPRRADDAYRSAVDWLKERCRGKDFPLVAIENAEYGFRCNLRGLRSFGMSVALLALLASLFGVWRLSGLASGDLRTGNWVEVLERIAQAPPVLIWGAVVVDIVTIVFWILVVRDSWVRQAGDQYARALLATCDRL